MEITKVLQKHIRDISISQEADLHREIDKFISENQNLSESELFDRIHSEYGRQIKFLENAAQNKAIISIKGWITTFGVFFLLGIVFLILFSFYSITH